MNSRVLIIGEGLSGSAAALGLADRGVPVVIISASRNLDETASFNAQGGIVYRGRGDSAQALASDIRIAGDSCGDPEMIRLLAAEGPDALERLLLNRLEVNFDRTPEGELSMTMEAAHSCSRIIHSSDATGASIMKKLQAATAEHPLITRFTGCTALDLLMAGSDCAGAEIINSRGFIENINSSITVLATVGAGSHL